MNYIAALDLGSNSFHALIARCEQGQIIPVEHHRSVVRLRTGLTASGELTSLIQEKALGVLTQFAERLNQYKPHHIGIVGTAVFRQSKNILHFLKTAQSILGAPIQILSGQAEATFIYRAVQMREGYWIEETPCLVLDIGGGSTEFVLGEGRRILATESLNISALALQAEYFESDLILPDRFKETVSICQNQFLASKYLFSAWEGGIFIVTSGLADAFAMITKSLHLGPTMDFETIAQIEDVLFKPDWQARLRYLGVSEDKLAILPAGLAILKGFMQAFDVEPLHPSSASLREGVAHCLATEPHLLQNSLILHQPQNA